MPYTFLFKKIAAAFVLPLGFSLVLLVIGWSLLFFRRRQRAAKVFIFAGFWPWCFPPWARLPTCWSSRSKNNIRPWTSPGPGPILWPCWEGAYQRKGPDKTAAALNRASFIRLAEGVRVHRLIPGSRLILSGGRGFARVSESEVMAETAVRMGVSRKDIILENKSADTEDQARLVKPIVGKGRLVLVTSAVHMPRAMALFRKAGMEPVPAPVDYLQNNSRGPRRYLPHALLAGEIRGRPQRVPGDGLVKTQGQDLNRLHNLSTGVPISGIWRRNFHNP